MRLLVSVFGNNVTENIRRWRQFLVTLLPKTYADWEGDVPLDPAQSAFGVKDRRMKEVFSLRSGRDQEHLRIFFHRKERAWSIPPGTIGRGLKRKYRHERKFEYTTSIFAILVL